MSEYIEFELVHNTQCNDDKLFISDLDDVRKCYLVVMSYGELTSISLNKTEVMRTINALTDWVAFHDLRSGAKNE